MLSGCLTEMPRVNQKTSDKRENQPKLQALLHWQELANQLADSLAQQEELFEEGQTVYVKKSEFETPFASAYYKLILSAFHEKGIPVTHNADNELTLSFSVQNVRHEQETGRGAVVFFNDLGSAVDKIFTGGSRSVAAPDSEEILVYTALSNTEADVFVLSQIAYINSNESHFYLEQKIDEPKSLGTKSYEVINEKNNI